MGGKWKYRSQEDLVGAFTAIEIRSLASQGIITPDTVIVCPDGREFPARKARNLTFGSAGASGTSKRTRKKAPPRLLASVPPPPPIPVEAGEADNRPSQPDPNSWRTSELVKKSIAAVLVAGLVLLLAKSTQRGLHPMLASVAWKAILAGLGGGVALWQWFKKRTP